jgi:L,D-transpeptidase YbiS
VALAVALLAVVWFGTGYRRELYVPPAKTAVQPATDEDRALQKEVDKLHAKVGKLAPRGSYIVVDRANNRLYLRKGDQVVIDATCSAGSGALLRDPNGDRKWVFDTPTGVFKVRQKIKDPVWRKPDWAFIEEGEPIPRNPGDRIEYGTLGEYALHFGNGYMIHGTLYERLLGRSLTHGCIRLGREDLRKLYPAAPEGTPIYIF